MSDTWDGLFESTSLNTNPNAVPKVTTKPAVVAPAAKTDPAPSTAPKRARKAKPTAATPVPEPAVDASIFFGSEETDDVGQAGATADAAAAAVALQEAADDDDFDPFADEDDDVPPVPALIAAPVTPPTPAPVPTAQATPAPAAKRGRPSGSKKKTTTAEQFTEALEKVERGEPVAEKTFPGNAEPNDSRAEAPVAPTLSAEIELLVRASTRIVLEEFVAFIKEQTRRP